MAEVQANLNRRTEMLAAIHARLREGDVHDAARASSHVIAPVAVATEFSGLDENPISLLDQFQERLAAVGGQCSIVTDHVQAAAILAGIVEQCRARRIAITDAPLVKQVTGGFDPALTILSQATAAELFGCDIGVTTAQWAIAESGTLVLESDRERNRLVSLVPPVHVAILDVTKVRRTMAEILHEVQRAEAGLSRAITFITGTSRTSDIELTLAIGVHGPAELYVIVITGAAA